MLKIQNISKRFGGVKALDACSFSIHSHEITALVGPNGAGKTTLFDVISGFVRADEGSITFSEQDITKMAPSNIARLGISRTWQQVRLFEYLTIRDHLRLAQMWDDTKLLRSMIGTALPVDESHIDQFGIDRPLDTLVSELSYGQRKLLQLAMVTIQPHQLLLLDEPVAGVNQVVQQRIETLLLQLRGKGETIIIVEHDIEFVKKLADRVVVMDQGSVLVEGTPAHTLNDPRVVEAYLGR